MMRNLKKLKFLTFFSIFIILVSIFVPSINSENNSKSNDEDFDSKIKTLLKTIYLPSAVVCIIKNESIAFMKPYGYSDLLLRKKAANDTVYLLGSVSKTVTATALMQLYDRGFFKLDDNINDYLPFEVKNPNHPKINITFRMILSHQASFNDFGIRLRFFPYMFYQARINKDSHELIKNMLTTGGKVYNRWFFFRTAPGERAFYDEIGIILAGILVEILSGQSLEDYCQDNIFKPLQMNNTSFYYEKLNHEKIAKPYVAFLSFNIPLPRYEWYFMDPPAGLWTTTEDLAKFFMIHINNGVSNGLKILNEDTTEIMHTKQYPSTPDILLGLLFRGDLTIHHGLGWFIIDIFNLDLEGHTGGTPGYSCHMYSIILDDGKKAGLILLANGPMLFQAFLSKKSVIDGYEEILNLVIQKANKL